LKDSRNDSFEKISFISDRVAEELGVERGLKEITLINLWPDIVGPRFKDKSKAVSVLKKSGYDSILVAVSSSIISQELYMFKKDILRKLSPMSKPMGFNVTDLTFSAKLWDEVKEKNILPEKQENLAHYFVKTPSDDEIKYINVPENIINLIKESIQTQNFTTNEQKDRLLGVIIKDLKIQIWRKNNGFPCCKKCEIPVNYYNPELEILCPSCKYLK